MSVCAARRLHGNELFVLFQTRRGALHQVERQRHTADRPSIQYIFYGVLFYSRKFMGISGTEVHVYVPAVLENSDEFITCIFRVVLGIEHRMG